MIARFERDTDTPPPGATAIIPLPGADSKSPGGSGAGAQINGAVSGQDPCEAFQKQSPRKWKWEEMVENERIQEMCPVEKIIHTNPPPG